MWGKARYFHADVTSKETKLNDKVPQIKKRMESITEIKNVVVPRLNIHNEHVRSKLATIKREMDCINEVTAKLQKEDDHIPALNEAIESTQGKIYLDQN